MPGADGLVNVPVDERELPDDEDPVAYVKSRNLHRRHLTGSQRSEAVIACSAWAPAGRPINYAPGAQLSAAAMAKEAGVGVRSIVQAKEAHRAGLGEAVRDGKVSVKRAAQIAKLPEPERAAASRFDRSPRAPPFSGVARASSLSSSPVRRSAP